MEPRENQSIPEKEKRTRAWLEFGNPTHESEYILSLEGFSDPKNSIPREITARIKENLGKEWDVSYRATRIEISNNQEFGKRDDEKVKSAVEKALGEKFKLEN